MKWKSKFAKVEWLNHGFGFLSVVLGVLLAFWLNDWNEGKKQQNRVNQGLVNLKAEIEMNISDVDTTWHLNSQRIKFVSDYLDLVDEDFEPVVSDSVLNAFMEENAKFIDTVSGSLLELDLYNLSDVALRTFFETNIIAAIDFELAVVIQEAYLFQKKLSDLDDAIIDESKGVGDTKSSLTRMITTVNLANDLAEELRDDTFPKALSAIKEYLQKHDFDLE